MKTIKIYAFPTHGTEKRTSGVDFARIIQPMTYLNGYSDGEVKFEVKIFDPKKDDKSKPESWINIAKKYDIIYFNYQPNAWGYAAMGAMARGQNKKLVLDLDDSLWDVKSDNSAYEVYHRGSEGLNNFTAICNDVDYITVTNQFLKNIVVNETYKYADKIKTFPNFIDLSRYNYRPKFKNDGKITLLHYGSSTHWNDLASEPFAKGIDRIMREYPNVEVKFVGAFLSKYRMRWGARYKNDFGAEDIYNWISDKFPKFMNEADIMVVPLTVDRYNKAKSSIKFLESASAKKPGVWERIRQYQEIVDGSNGLLVSTEDEWYNAIKKLIDNPDFRKTMGEKAFATAKKWDIKNYIKEYAKFFKMVLDN